MRNLTDRQKQVLEFIRDFIGINRYPPTIREISQHFGFSVKGGYDHVKALQRKGVLKCQGNRSRAIEITDGSVADPLMRSVPILGSVAAGKPLFAEENFQGAVSVPATGFSKGQHFALHVKGDSMRDAGILDGDLVIVRQASEAENGEIVVAMVDDAVTLKRFYKEKNRVRLKAENPRFPPIYTQNVRILGILASLIRHYE
jgi:repressor LexA